MRIAIAGKGGTGKTTVAALLCRSLLNRGTKPLLAVDADPNSCLPDKLGVAREKTIGELREELRADPEKMPAGISKSEWIESLINQEISESTGFDMVVMGRQEGPDCYCFINNLLRQCLDKLGSQYEAVVIDNEAGLEHLSRRSNGTVEVLLVVCQPTLIGARTALRIVELSKSLNLDIGNSYLILNACDGELSDELVAEFEKSGLEIAARIPTDSEILDFELEDKSLTELSDDSVAALAGDDIIERIFKEVQ
jgi:CO dehydrogenase maturation factor